MSNIEIFIKGLGGLGANIGHLSLLIDNYQSIDFYANKGCRMDLDPIKQALQLDKIQIHDEPVDVSNYHVSNISDHDKFFSPYFNVDNIMINGITMPTGKRDKKCIAIACYQRTVPNHAYENKKQDAEIIPWPFCRYYSLDEYSIIFKLAKLAGYDIITLDSHEITFTEKIYMLNELCDCVIGYEGGLAHLAHVLKIPSIILPWHRMSDGTKYRHVVHNFEFDPFCDYGYKMHLDKRTYFPNSITEVLDWTPEQLKEIINNLHNEKGNNPYLSTEYKLTIDNHGHYQFVYKNVASNIIDIKEISSIYALNLVKSNSKELAIGGYNPITQVEKL